MTVIRLDPGQNEAESDTISVADGETKVISIFTDTDGVAVPSGVDMKLQRKNAADFWQDVYAPALGHVVFTSMLLNVVVTAVGDYRVVRPNITAQGVNVGVSED